jgi:hypothetical protein
MQRNDGMAENTKKTLEALEDNFDMLSQICSGMYKMIAIDNPGNIPVRERIIDYIGENSSWYRRFGKDKAYTLLSNSPEKQYLKVHLHHVTDWKTFITQSTEGWLYFIVHNWDEVDKEKDREQMHRQLKDILEFLEENGVFECFYFDAERSRYVSPWQDGVSWFDIVLNAVDKIYVYTCYGDT